MALAFNVTPKQTELIAKTFMHRDLLHDGTINQHLSWEEIFTNILQPAGLNDAEHTLAYCQTVQRILARATHEQFSTNEFNDYLTSISELPNNNKEILNNFWNTHRQTILDAVALREFSTQPRYNGMSFAIITNSADSSNSSNTSEPSVVFSITRTHNNNDASNNEYNKTYQSTIQVEANKSTLSNVLYTLGQLRRELA